MLKALEEAARMVKRSCFKEALIVHHDEADGVCSAAIAAKSLERMGIEFKAICLDKLYPEVLRGIYSRGVGLYVFTDIGSAHVRLLEKEAYKGGLTVILDHHDTVKPTRDDVLNLNPELWGLSGERDASSSTIAYLFAKALNPSNVDLSPLAVIGSAEIPGPLVGANRLALDHSLVGGFLKPSGKADYKILTIGKPLSYKRYSTILSVLASVGYYRGGPARALRACMEGFKSEDYEEASKLEMERKRANARLMAILRRGGLRRMRAIQWFSDSGVYMGMGGKVIGSFCSYLRYRGFVDKDKYIAGYMEVPSEVPGYGRLSKVYVKISTRAPKPLTDMILRGEKPPLSGILPKACSMYGGFADGHAVAASGVVERNKIIQTLEKLDELALG